MGRHTGKRVFLPRIPLCPFDDEMFPFQFKRKQFPIRLSFAMMVNKSLGQTIPNVGMYLPTPMFSHGQLFVAISRATARTNIKSLSLPPNAEAEEEEAKRIEQKNARNAKHKGKGQLNKKYVIKTKKIEPIVNDTYTKKEVLTL
jgi:ATP-dependent DNA helicase PIF1